MVLTVPNFMRCSKIADHLITSGFSASSILATSLKVKVFHNVSTRAQKSHYRNPGHTLRMVVGGIQCVKRSYSLARTCRILAGERSAMISSAVNEINASQSGGGIAVESVTFSL